MLIVELRRLWGGALFRNIHETTMEWSECGAAPAVSSERGTSLAPGGARDGGHSFCFGVASFDGSLLLTIFLLTYTQILSPTLECFSRA